MEFYRLRSADAPFFDEAFVLYEISFPEHERRLPGRQEALMRNSRYHFNAIVESGALVGILLCWEGTGYAYIEHFAIQPSMRGKALGSAALKRFCAEHPCVVLEIDPPVDAISIRRKGFYQRLGFFPNDYDHLHPAYKKDHSPHPLVMMSYPAPMTEAEYDLFRRELCEIVMSDEAD